MRIERLLDAPIIHAWLDSTIGHNIQGPSLIRVPDWVTPPLGRYYLYFADHKGRYIRLACADALTGPWRVHAPDSLRLAASHFPTEPPAVSDETLERLTATLAPSALTTALHELTTPHIASPDVHVDDATQTIVMYFHGLDSPGVQVTRVATSIDGIDFAARPQILGESYFRAFDHGGMTYAMAMPGQFYRSRDGFEPFEPGPRLFNPDMRHAAVAKCDETLFVFWTQVGDAPEKILLSTIDVSGGWETWKTSKAVEALRPERDWEGANAPLEPSVRGAVCERVNQLRDPAIYTEDDRSYLLYAVAGESGIGIAEVSLDQ